METPNKRAASKDARASASNKKPRAEDAEHSRATIKQSPSTPSSPSASPRPSSSTTRRPFFGVIDNVSSFSGIIEGPYDFGFAISITVDRQTFKGVVFKSNPQDQGQDSVFPDEEVMVNFAHNVPAAARASNANKPTSRPNPSPNQSQEEVRLPDITTFTHFSNHEAPRTPLNHDSPRTPLNHDPPRTPHTAHAHSHEEPPSPNNDDQHSESDDHHHPHHDEHLPAIHSVLQGIGSSTFSPPTQQSHHSSGPSSVSSPPPPLPPQPQLQRQKQRQKKRQEKKLLELQQQQPARYQSMLDRERSKIPLLGDESLVNAGMEILQHIDGKH